MGFSNAIFRRFLSHIDRLWVPDTSIGLARRAAEMDQGLSKRIPAEDVRREAQALIG